MRVAQAARRSSTRVRAMRSASSGLAAVVSTTRAKLPASNGSVMHPVYGRRELAPSFEVVQYVACGEEPMSKIKFGTSGWRAIVADEFTVANIRLAVSGIASYVKTLPAPHRVLVGRDPRFLGENFVNEAASVLAAAGVTPIVIPKA